MLNIKKATKILLLLMSVALVPASLSAEAVKDKKVMVVMSYHPESAWQQGIKNCLL